MTVITDDGPYLGKNEKLIISIDIGTTTSAVCLAHLQPGAIPKTKVVTSWPYSDQLKIPSALYYDKSNKARYFAAEVIDDCIMMEAMEKGYTKVENFKLLLHPASMASTITTAIETTSSPYFEVPTLPAGLTIEQVYSDYIRYLMEHTKAYFEATSVTGDKIWENLFEDATFILAHPDGWSTLQQEVLRKGLIGALSTSICTTVYSPSASEITTRIEFLRESEASLYFSLEHGNDEWLKTGALFTIVDAGGSTIDTSLYSVTSSAPNITLVNAKASECIQAGGIFFTRAGRQLITSKLSPSAKFCRDDFINELVNTFELNTKRKFDGKSSKTIMRIVNCNDSEPSVGILKGRLTLDSSEVEEKCFKPFVDDIIESVRRQTIVGNFKSSNIILVGGLGDSPFLKAKLKVVAEGISVTTSDLPTSKAVAEGACLHFIKRLVVSRASRSTFGIGLVLPYNKLDPEHQARQPTILADRTRGVNGGWSTIMAKDTVVSVREFTTCSYNRIITDVSNLKSFEIPLYTCDQTPTDWMQDAYGNILPGFLQVCSIEADLSLLENSLEKKVGAGGMEYILVKFAIGISFGTNSLNAKLIWTEMGVKKEGPCSIVLSALTGSEK